MCRKIVKNRENLFEKILIELLINIISFLTNKFFTICKNICKI